MGVGYYALMWGQIRDDDIQRDQEDRNEDSLQDKVPLLQDDSQA